MASKPPPSAAEGGGVGSMKDAMGGADGKEEERDDDEEDEEDNDADAADQHAFVRLLRSDGQLAEALRRAVPPPALLGVAMRLVEEAAAAPPIPVALGARADAAAASAADTGLKTIRACLRARSSPPFATWLAAPASAAWLARTLLPPHGGSPGGPGGPGGDGVALRRAVGRFLYTAASRAAAVLPLVRALAPLLPRASRTRDGRACAEYYELLHVALGDTLQGPSDAPDGGEAAGGGAPPSAECLTADEAAPLFAAALGELLDGAVARHSAAEGGVAGAEAAAGAAAHVIGLMRLLHALAGRWPELRRHVSPEAAVRLLRASALPVTSDMTRVAIPPRASAAHALGAAALAPLVPLDAAGVPYSFLLSVAEGGGGLAAALLREMWRVHSCHGDAASWRGTYGLVPPPRRPTAAAAAAAGAAACLGARRAGVGLRRSRQPRLHVLHGVADAAALHVPVPCRRPARCRRRRREARAGRHADGAAADAGDAAALARAVVRAVGLLRRLPRL